MSVLFKNEDGSVSAVAGLIYSSLPIGSIIAYMGQTAPPYWLLCDGSTFDTSTFTELANVLGSNTLPDLRNKTPFGAGDKTLGTSSDGSLPNITASTSIQAGQDQGGAFKFKVTDQAGLYKSGTYWKSGFLTLNANDSSKLYKDGQNYVEPASVRCNFIIKAL